MEDSTGRLNPEAHKLEKALSKLSEAKPLPLMYQQQGSRALFVLFATTFGLAVFDYLMLQVLPSYPFYFSYDWSFAHSQSLSLEVFGAMSFLAYALWSVGKNKSLLAGIGQSLFSYGLLLSSMVYLETTIPWMVTRSGGGYPWPGERVAYDTCILGSNGVNCAFLNYSELAWMSLALSFLGLVLWRYYRRGTQDRRMELKQIAMRFQT
jgi:hypothetical protein